MKPLIKIFFIFLIFLTLISVLILKLNVYNLAYQTVFFTNKDVTISNIKVNNEPVYKQENDDNKKRIYPVTINTIYPTKIQLGKQTRYIKLNQLKKDKYININIISFKNKKLNRTNYHLHLLHNNFPELDIENKGINKGYIFTNYTYAQGFPAHVFIMDINGNIVFYRTNRNPKYSVFNLQKWKTKNNEIFYSLHEQTKDISEARYMGDIFILDKNFRVVDSIRALPTSKHPVLDADEHDFILLDKNHYIVLSDWIKKIKKDSSVFSYADSVIQEIKDGKVLFDWVVSENENITDDNHDSQAYILADVNSNHSIHESTNIANEKKINKNMELYNDRHKNDISLAQHDLCRINSIAIDSLDNNMLVSCKNKNAVVKIDRQTGKKLWQLGGLYDEFNLSNEEKFKLQHHAHFEHNDILYIFDNFSHKSSRIIKYQFDKEHKKIIKKEFIDLNYFVHSMGSVQMIDDNKMIVSYENGLRYAINIIDSERDIYWGAKFDNEIIKTKRTKLVPYIAIYRAYYYETID